MAVTKLTDKEMNDLKSQVLIERMEYLCGELGDPARYHAALRAKGVLSQEDIERVKAKVTGREKVQELIELIHKRRSDQNRHAMDVLMDALKKQKVQAHIARELQKALARAKERKGLKGKDGSLSPQTPSSVGSHMMQATQTPSGPPSLETPLSPPSTMHSMAPPGKYEVHPEHGPLPNLPLGIARKAEKHHSPVSQPPNNIDPNFGPLPGLPPPRHGTVRPVPVATSPGMGDVQLNSNPSFSSMASSVPYPPTHCYNGDGQYSLGEGEGQFSDISDRRSSQSCTTASGTVYSSSSTEQSGREYQDRRLDRVLALEAKVEEMEDALHKKSKEVNHLRQVNEHMSQKLRDTTDKYEQLQKEHAQMSEKLRQKSLSDQQQMLDSFQHTRKQHGNSSEQLEENARILKELKEKQRLINSLEEENKNLKRYVEQYQRDNQRLQLSLSSTSSSRPHHLPIGSKGPHPMLPPHSPYTPNSPNFNHATVSDTPAAPGITPFRSMRVGDHLSQHNIHIQQSRLSPHGQSPLFSPAKEAASKRHSSSSGDTPMGENCLQSSNSSINSMHSNGSKGSAGVTLQQTGSERATMV